MQCETAGSLWAHSRSCDGDTIPCHHVLLFNLGELIYFVFYMPIFPSPLHLWNRSRVQWCLQLQPSCVEDSGGAGAAPPWWWNLTWGRSGATEWLNLAVQSNIACVTVFQMCETIQIHMWNSMHPSYIQWFNYFGIVGHVIIQVREPGQFLFSVSMFLFNVSPIYDEIAAFSRRLLICSISKSSSFLSNEIKIDSNSLKLAVEKCLSLIENRGGTLDLQV